LSLAHRMKVITMIVPVCAAVHISALNVSFGVARPENLFALAIPTTLSVIRIASRIGSFLKE
jgi:hypothetical protein